ncbi:MAG: phosphoribosyltransferase [Alphaproteobacteria bacterium]|nr:phosphoribosyltransferase [Alphaproteobacteria bacterium]MBM4437551.1 phosphoribosyltransferase [Actinomycetota bacterium]
MTVEGVHETHFHDRRDAGRRLASVMRKFKSANPIVLALPRGGLPVAYDVAKELKAPLDILFVRKIGAPGHPDVDLGAVVDGAHPEIVLNDSVVRMLAPDQAHIDAETRRELAEIERRRTLYLNGREPPEARGRTVIVVDDGVATGGTVKAALKAIDRHKPEWLVLAIPVAPPQALLDLQSAADEVVCLSSPEPFWAVGAYYQDFTETTDEEVMALLGANRARMVEPDHGDTHDHP